MSGPIRFPGAGVVPNQMDASVAAIFGWSVAGCLDESGIDHDYSTQYK